MRLLDSVLVCRRFRIGASLPPTDLIEPGNSLGNNNESPASPIQEPPIRISTETWNESYDIWKEALGFLVMERDPKSASGSTVEIF